MLKQIRNSIQLGIKKLRRLVAKLPLYIKLPIATAVLLAAIPLGLQYRHHQLYTVTTSTRQLLPKATIDHSKIKQTNKAISYNEADQTPTGDTEVTIAGPTEATGQTGYQATINKDFARGMNFGDSNSELSFNLTPLFGASKGEYKDGQVMFPVSTTTKVFQTFKKNGIKEDIVLTKSPGKTAQWQWKLNLSDKLEAKLLPDGSVGIFAANPNLYGNLQISDEKSQKLIDKAKTTDKTYQIFAIPAPYIKDSKGREMTEDVSFKLTGNTLTLEARNLDNKSYPISIDPSAVITTTADFATGTDDGMVNYSTANQIGRSNVSLGSVGATTQQTSAFTTARRNHASAAYNGYLYIIGGSAAASATGCDANGRCNDVIRCTISPTDGSVSSCTQQTSAFTTPRSNHTSVVYNGYLYVVGGKAAASATGCDANGYCNDIHYCPINADGSIGTCTQQTSAITTVRWQHTSVAYNGYLYVIGGNTTILERDIIYCPINVNGSIGTCVQQTNAFTSARSNHTSVAYNGYLYIIGGCSSGDCSAFESDVQRCPINANGSIGTCTQQTSAFTTGRYQHTSVVYNGYIYIIGGCSAGIAGCTTFQNDIQRLPVNTGTPSGFGAAGTTTQQLTAFTTPRQHHTSVAYNGYLYVIGGYGTGTGCDGSLRCNDIIHCPINTNGSVGTCTQQLTAFTTARSNHTSVTYNGYLYVIGGGAAASATGCDAAGRCNDVQRCPINSDGSVGSCIQQLTAFTTPRDGHTSVAYNGYLYVVGGYAAASATGCDASYRCSDVIHCTISTSDGSVSSCTQQLTAFAPARGGHTSVAYNGYLYVIGGGGTGTGCANDCNDVIHCTISTSDGSVSSCTQQTSAFTTFRTNHTSVAYNGYLYIIGGYPGGGIGTTDCPTGNNSARCGDIQRCPFNSDGSVGTCIQQLSAFTSDRYSHTSVAYNGYLYVIGGWAGFSATGCDANGYCNDVQRLSLQSPAQAAHYERVVDIGKTADTVDSIQYNGTAKCGAKVQYATAGSNGAFGALTTLQPDAVPSVTYALSGQTVKRYVRVVITLNDQDCGGTSSVTDLTVNYTLLPPLAPTLSAPANGAINASLTPVFQFKSTDALDTYAQYKILVYQSDCSTLVRTIDQTASQTGWSGQDAQTSTAYVVATILASSTLASHTYQATALNPGTTYCWKAAAIDPGGSNIFGNFSATQTFTTNYTPTVPTLTQPAAGQTGIPTLPEFRLYSTDLDGDYLRYKIEVCSTSNCSVVVRTIDQTASQTGWQFQSQQASTAYASAQGALHLYQAAALTANTQYWWRAYVIDPAGANTLTSASGIGTFTTAATTQPNVNINGSTTIYGGSTIRP